MKAASIPAVLSALAIPIAAQSVTASVSAPNPIVVSATDGAVTAQDSAPAGPLGAFGSVQAVMAGASTRSVTTWFVASHATGSGIQVDCDLQSDSSTAVVAGGPNEFVMQFAAPASAPASIKCLRWGGVAPGVPWPAVRLDFGNDGTIDIPDVAMGEFTLPTSIVSFDPGVQPFVVRIVVDATVVGVGACDLHFQVLAVPRNDLLVDQSLPGCLNNLVVAPVFADRGVDFRTGLPLVLVFGLSMQPVVLSVFATPCVLVPATDILVWLPASSSYHVALPPSLRPVTFWAQSVWIATDGLVPDNAYRIAAW